ncbi:hypothetical protein J6590_044773 [Homalodisca vitripennis]|nr:hypothetical protein J6590_044773 [Homalodisca vitripennis]
MSRAGEGTVTVEGTPVPSPTLYSPYIRISAIICKYRQPRVDKAGREKGDSRDTGAQKGRRNQFMSFQLSGNPGQKTCRNAQARRNFAVELHIHSCLSCQDEEQSEGRRQSGAGGARAEETPLAGHRAAEPRKRVPADIIAAKTASEPLEMNPFLPVPGQLEQWPGDNATMGGCGGVADSAGCMRVSAGLQLSARRQWLVYTPDNLSIRARDYANLGPTLLFPRYTPRELSQYDIHPY